MQKLKEILKESQIFKVQFLIFKQEGVLKLACIASIQDTNNILLESLI